jgi:hypothetical protein
MPDFPYQDRPCNNCPFRADIPAGEFPPERFAALRNTVGERGREAGLSAPIFACHKSTPGRDRACAGWLATCGYSHLRVRLAVATRALPGRMMEPGPDWPELYNSYDEMAAANGDYGDG